MLIKAEGKMRAKKGKEDSGTNMDMEAELPDDG